MKCWLGNGAMTRDRLARENLKDDSDCTQERLAEPWGEGEVQMQAAKKR